MDLTSLVIALVVIASLAATCFTVASLAEAVLTFRHRRNMKQLHEAWHHHNQPIRRGK